MEKEICCKYLDILSRELVPALGCTEPIAIAFAAAKLRQVLGLLPEAVSIHCSGNIIKNVKGVTVPNSGGLKGIEAAAALGLAGGDADLGLEVLSTVTDEHRKQAAAMMAENRFTCHLIENVDNLYIEVKGSCGERSAAVTVEGQHTRIARIVLDEETIFEAPTSSGSHNGGKLKYDMSVREILEFAETVDVAELEASIGRQISCNREISDYGLTHDIGARVGHTLLQFSGENVKARAKARAAAGSDARMSGCSLPVVINSGSGNQGLTVSLPVIEYAEHLGVGIEKMYRALAVSNLISIHLKQHIGSLSAFCGAVTAACGAGAAISYLHGGDYNHICDTITNVLGNVSGVVCDGAKPSCAAKIASSVDAAIMAHELSMQGLSFKDGEGLVQKDIEDTINAFGYIGRIGMHNTDQEILRVMTGETAI